MFNRIFNRVSIKDRKRINIRFLSLLSLGVLILVSSFFSDHIIPRAQAVNVPMTGVTAIAGGNTHTVVLKNDGTVWCFGSNANGELGNGTNTGGSTPVKASGLSNVTAIAAGESFTVALDSNGEVWTWGDNLYGALGNGGLSTADSNVPIKASQSSGMTGVIAIAAGNYHVLAVRGSDGAVFAWGKNESGQIGTGDTVGPQKTPWHVSGLSGITKVTGGFQTSAALKSDGTVYAWGQNGFGNLGNGVSTGSYTPVQVPSFTSVADFEIAFAHNMALKSNGNLWSWGNNQNGQLGIGTTTVSYIPVQVTTFVSNVITVGTSGYAEHTLAVKDNGTVWAWGWNMYGVLGNGTSGPTAWSSTPVQATGLTGITAVATGTYHSIALKNDGSVWTWGSNSFGQLGPGTGRSIPNTYSTPSQVLVEGFSITSSAGTGGSISPNGVTSKETGSSQSYTIAPDPSYHIVDVLVDSVSQGPTTTYSFSNIIANHTISATFAIDTFTIVSSAGSGGSISPLGSTSVNSGSSQSYSIDPAVGYDIEDVVVDSVSVGPVTSYDFNNVTDNHTISATFVSSGPPAGIIITPTSGLTTNEFGGTATFTVTLNAQPTSDVTVPISSSNTGEGNIFPLSLTFTNANWNIPQTVTISGVDDQVVDGTVTYDIVTATAISTDPRYSGINADDVSVDNIDLDIAGVTVNPVSGLVTTESGGTASFSVVLDTQPGFNVTIGLSSLDTTEGVVVPASLTFTTTNWNTPQTVTVTGVDDLIADGTVPYTIVTSIVVSADVNYNGIDPSDVSLNNSDNDIAGITVTPTLGLTTTESGGTDTFTIALNTQPTSDVTIDLSSSDSTEGTVSPSSVVFNSSNWNIPQVITVTGVDDLLDDGDIAYSIITALAVSADINYDNKDSFDVSVTNDDNDTAGVTISDIHNLTDESGGTGSFTIVLDSQPTSDVTIPLTSDNTSEGTIAIASVTFTTANWNIPQTVTVTGIDDDPPVSDGSVTYHIITGDITSSDSVYGAMLDASIDDVTMANQNNDAPGIVVTVVDSTTTETGETATVQFVLLSQPTSDVTIPLSISDSTEGTLGAITQIVITPANWNNGAANQVTITGLDDLVSDGDISYDLVTGDPTSVDGDYGNLIANDVADVTLSNIDNDFPGITVTPTSGLITTEAGGSTTFTVVLNTQPTADVTIDLSSSDITEGNIDISTLTFTSANWNAPQTVTVTGADDVLDDDDSNYNIITDSAVSTDVAYNGLGSSDVSVTNLDNDPAPSFVESLLRTSAPAGTHIKWNQVNNATSYKLYKGSGSSSDVPTIGELSEVVGGEVLDSSCTGPVGSECSIDDTTVASALACSTSYYAIRVVGSNGLISEFSNIVPCGVDNVANFSDYGGVGGVVTDSTNKIKVTLTQEVLDSQMLSMENINTLALPNRLDTFSFVKGTATILGSFNVSIGNDTAPHPLDPDYPVTITFYSNSVILPGDVNNIKILQDVDHDGVYTDPVTPYLATKDRYYKSGCSKTDPETDGCYPATVVPGSISTARVTISTISLSDFVIVLSNTSSPSYNNPSNEDVSQPVIPEVPETPITPITSTTNTLEEVLSSPLPSFPSDWGVGYGPGRDVWANEHRKNIYNLYLDYLGRAPSILEVNWQFQHESNIEIIKSSILNSTEYSSKQGGPTSTTNTLEEVLSSPLPSFPSDWGVGYEGGRNVWANEHRKNIYNLYINYIGRAPTILEVNWQFQHESNIDKIKYFMLISSEYNKRQVGVTSLSKSLYYRLMDLIY